MKYFSIFFLTLVSVNTLADLGPYDFDILLSSDRNTYTRNEVIQLNITFTNMAGHTNGIILPGTKNKGKRLLYLSYYSVDSNDFYTNVHTESRVIAMDTSNFGQVHWKNLYAGKSVTVPIFLNDSTNYRTNNAAHHRLPNLPAGNYQVLAWYAPWDEPMAEHAFAKLNPFGRSDDDFVSKRFYMHETQQSNYFSLTISNDTVKHAWSPTKACPLNCHFCEAIEKSDWNKVERLLSKQTDYTNKLGMNFLDTNWLQPHRNVAWMYEGPDAILASLPTYTYRSMILKNQTGYFYYAATWQLGIIYPGRSRIQQMFRWSTRLNAPIRSSEVDYQKIVKFAPS